MADTVNFADVTVPVGEQVRVALKVDGDAPDGYLLSCDQDTIAVPALEDGTPLTWPHPVAIVDGEGAYFLLGLSPGTAQHFVTAVAPQENAGPSGTVSVTVEHGNGGSIAEPIVISITSPSD